MSKAGGAPRPQPAITKPRRPTAAAQPTPDPRFADLSWATLAGLQRKPHIYAGTVPPAEIARRRERNRTSRWQRRGNTAALARQARLNRDHRPRFRRGQAPDPLGLHTEAAAS